MWPLLVPLVLQWTLIASLPVSEDVRPASQSGPGECCPCPGATEESLPRAADDSIGEASAVFPAVLPGPRASAASDGCQCMLRNADAAAAASFDLPRHVLPFRTAMSQPDMDPRPLLQPEVGLASSVLETLRQATDEEYREALARDAARSVARSSEDLKTSPAHVVTIILNPADVDDDILAQGTHAHESRCIHGPLGSARVANVKTRQLPGFIRELLGMPVDTVGRSKLNMLDSGAAASNAREQFVDSSNVNEVKVNPELEFKSAQGPTTPKLPSLIDTVKDFTSKARVNFEEAVKRNPYWLNFPNLHVSKPVELHRMTDLSDGLKDVESVSDSTRDDNLNAPSNVHETVVINQARKVPDFSGRANPTIFNKVDLLDSLEPILPKNFIKLRDSDSISKGILDNIGEKEIKIKVPYLKNIPWIETAERTKNPNPSTWSLPSISDLFNGNSMDTKTITVKPDVKTETTEEPEINDLNTNSFRTEIIDALPSASVNKITQINPEPLPIKANDFRAMNSGDCSQEDLSNNPDRGIIESLNDNTVINPANLEEKDNDTSEREFSDEQDTKAEASSVETTDSQTQNEDPANEYIQEPSFAIVSGNQAPEKSTPSIGVPNIKEKVLRKLDEFKKQKGFKLTDSTQTDFKKQDESTTEREAPVKDSVETVNNPVTSEELKDMSDSLLDESHKREEIQDPNCSDAKSKIIKKPIEETTVTQFSSAEGIFETSSVPNDPVREMTSTEDQSTDVVAAPTQQNYIVIAKATCDTQTLQSKNSKLSNLGKAALPEMAAASSDALAKSLTLPSLFDNPNRLLGSRLMQSPIVQPAVLPGIGSIFPDLSDIFRSNPEIPTLDELGSKISEFFIKNNKDESSMDQDDESNVNFPHIAASNGQGAPLSLRRPMQDVDFDIFQLNPLKLPKTASFKSNVPRQGLNMNNFKARLQVPAEAIKPLNLKSIKSFKGKDGNIFGAKLSAAPRVQKFDNLGRAQPTLLSDLSSRRTVLGDSLPDLPSLESIARALDSRNILGAPHNLLPGLRPMDNIRSAEPLIQLDALRENIRSDASNAMNSLQQSLASSLSDAKLRHENVLGKALESGDLLDNLAKAKSDIDDRLQSMKSDFATKLPLLNIDGLTDDFARNSILQLPHLDTRTTKQPKFATSSKISQQRKQPKTSSNLKQKNSSNLQKGKSGFRGSSKDTSKLRSDNEVTKRPLFNTRSESSIPKSKSTLSDNKESLTKTFNMKDSNLAASNQIPSRLAIAPTNWLPQDLRNALTPLKLSESEPSSADSLLSQMRDSLHESLSRSDPIIPLDTLRESVNTQLTSSLKPLKDLMEGASEKQDSLLGFPKLAIENLKKPQEVVDDILSSARESLANVNIDRILQKSSEPIVKLPTANSEKLRNNLDTLRNKALDVASPTEVLSSLRDSIKERFSEIDSGSLVKGLPARRITDMTQEASGRLENSAPPNTVFDTLNDRLASLKLPQLKGVEEITPLDLLDNLKVPTIDIQSPQEVISNLRSSARNALADLDLQPLPSLPALQSSGDLLAGASENLRALLDAPVKSLASDKLRSSIQDALSDLNLQLPITKTKEIPNLRSNYKDDNLENVRNIVDDSDAINSVTNLRNSFRDRLSKVGLAKNRDLVESPSDNLRTAIAAPRSAAKRKNTYRCKMVCEGVDDE